MDGLTLIGVSHRRGGAGALEDWQATFDVAALEALELGPFVLLTTCNRWEVTLARPDAHGLDALRGRLTPAGQIRPYAFGGDAALEHLTRVAASLEALNPGEDQIMRQVREAYREAKRRGGLDGLLAYAFETALRIAKRVRREIPLAPFDTSLFSLARPDLEALLQPGDRAVVIGAGAIGALAARSLAELPGVRLTVVNRDGERARRLADGLAADAQTLNAFRQAPGRVRAIVCATPVAQLLDASLLARTEGLELIVDLGIPRNVAPTVAADLGLRHLDVDALRSAGERRRAGLVAHLARAEQIVAEELLLAEENWTERQLGPSILRLHGLLEREVGASLPPEEAQRLARRIAHLPIKGLRAVAREHGLAAARTFLLETGLLE